MDTLAGRILGSYRLVEQIGAGGMAVIYRADDQYLDRSVAIKILSPTLGLDHDFTARFLSEARRVAHLSHPNILPVYGYGEQEGMRYFVMQLVQGGTLGQFMGKPHLAPRIVALIVQVAYALHYAHEQGIVHRDVKPANILLSHGGWALLSDFGIATVLEERDLVQNQGVMGTPHYMAPEQAQGLAVGPYSDQYSLGVVLYELVTGSRPFHAATPEQVAYQQVYIEPLSPRRRNSEVPHVLEAVIVRAMAKAPEGRFASMADFAGELGAALVTLQGGVPTPTLQRQLLLSGVEASILSPQEAPSQVGVPLTLPDPETLSLYDSITLFVQIARQVDRNFSVTNQSAAAVATICQKLWGVRGAITVAAARAGLLPPKVMLARLESRVKGLKSGLHTPSGKQQILHILVDWSYDMLSAPDRHLLARLSVFDSSFSLRDAEVVCTPEHEQRPSILDSIISLVSANLLEQPRGDELRFEMPDFVRVYALDKLRASDEEERVVQRLAGYRQSQAGVARLPG